MSELPAPNQAVQLLHKIVEERHMREFIVDANWHKVSREGGGSSLVSEETCQQLKALSAVGKFAISTFPWSVAALAAGIALGGLATPLVLAAMRVTSKVLIVSDCELVDGDIFFDSGGLSGEFSKKVRPFLGSGAVIDTSNCAGTACGTVGAAKWKMKGTNTTVCVMWCNPFDRNLHNLAFGIGIDKGTPRSEPKDAKSYFEKEFRKGNCAVNDEGFSMWRFDGNRVPTAWVVYRPEVNGTQTEWDLAATMSWERNGTILFAIRRRSGNSTRSTRVAGNGGRRSA